MNISMIKTQLKNTTTIKIIKQNVSCQVIRKRQNVVEKSSAVCAMCQLYFFTYTINYCVIKKRTCL